MEKNAEEIKSFVRERYASLAKEQQQSCCSPQASASCCGGNTSDGLNLLLKGYSVDEVMKLSEDVAGFSLGCGNPTAIAELSPGEVVLDLGSGGGIDCFLASPRVGAAGRVIGLDMTPEMISLAKGNAQKMEVTNVEFRLGEMERMPVEDGSVDVIISNCVINLSPDKDAVFKEAYRVLKPGGRLCVSDIVLLGELPEKVKQDLLQWAGCVAGALQKDDYLDKIKAAGFVRAEVAGVPKTLNRVSTPEMPRTLDLENKVASISVKAFKPGKV